jgi:hypothetical protein
MRGKVPSQLLLEMLLSTKLDQVRPALDSHREGDGGFRGRRGKVESDIVVVDKLDDDVLTDRFERYVRRIYKGVEGIHLGAFQSPSSK